jgi:DNA-binding transcriptional MerR regulator
VDADGTHTENGEHTYTIDELAQASGVPARTIRFYQAEGVLPWPEKRGRIAVYHDSHLERLEAIGVMQRRGLQLAAIRDLLSLDDSDRLSVRDWLGLQAEALAPVSEQPLELSEAELIEHIGPDHAELVTDLESIGLVRRLPSGNFRLPLPTMLDITLEFHDVGVQVPTSSELAQIIIGHLTRAAEEILTFVRGRIGETFVGSREPADIARALEVVDRRAVEAVGLMWADVMHNAVRDFQASLEDVFGTPDETSDATSEVGSDRGQT